MHVSGVRTCPSCLQYNTWPLPLSTNCISQLREFPVKFTHLPCSLTNNNTLKAALLLPGAFIVYGKRCLSLQRPVFDKQSTELLQL